MLLIPIFDYNPTIAMRKVNACDNIRNACDNIPNACDNVPSA